MYEISEVKVFMGISLEEFMRMSPSDRCWATGCYTDDCICEICDHRFECSGYDDHEDD